MSRIILLLFAYEMSRPIFGSVFLITGSSSSGQGVLRVCDARRSLGEGPGGWLVPGPSSLLGLTTLRVCRKFNEIHQPGAEALKR